MKALKKWADLLPFPIYSVLIMCFFFPFLIIKCGDMELANANGFELMGGFSEKEIESSLKDKMDENNPFSSLSDDEDEDDYDDDYNYEDEDEDEGDVIYDRGDNDDNLFEDEEVAVTEKKEEDTSEFNFILIVSFLMAIVGLIIQCIKPIKNKPIIQLILSGLGFLGMLANYIIMQVGISDAKKEMGMGASSNPFTKDLMITFEFGFAYYFVMFLFLIIVGFYGYYIYTKNSLQQNLSSSVDEIDAGFTNEI